MRFSFLTLLCGIIFFPSIFSTVLAEEPASHPQYLGPTQVVTVPPDDASCYVLCQDARTGSVVNGEAQPTMTMLPGVSGAVIFRDAKLVATTFGGANGKVKLGVTLDDAGREIPVGHTPLSPVFSADGTTLFVPCRFSNDIAVIDVAKGEVIRRISTVREPIAAALTPDGKTLVVANHLPSGRADTFDISAAVTLVDTTTFEATHVRLLNGSTGLRDVAISPDGKYAYIPHILARYQMPTTQLERGWMNTNALSIFDIGAKKLLNTVLLDDVDRGAAVPWGVAVSADGKTVVVTHSGTHEASVIDIAGVLEKIAKIPQVAPPYDPNKPYDDRGNFSSPSQADIPNDLAFLVGLRTRVPLPVVGPRGVTIVGSKAYIAGYFSDSLAVIDLTANPLRRGVTEIALGPKPVIDQVRQGEIFFTDAALCFQNWQSCTSCHPDARTDGLNWDLMNDGLGNPKNNRSMLLAHVTTPSMWSGIRATAEDAVRSGIRHIQFAVRPDEDAQAIDAYLKTLTPEPSPRLVNGQLSEAAQRGQTIFEKEKCNICHPAPLYTDRAMHNVKTRAKLDRRDDFDTPTLVETWRTAPYLHDGRYATMRELFEDGLHGLNEKLSEQELSDLAEFVESL